MSYRASENTILVAHSLLKRLSADSLPRALSVRDSVFRLAKEFEQATGRAPHIEELEIELNDRMDSRGRITFYFNDTTPPEKTYADIFKMHMGHEITDHEINIFDTSFGQQRQLQEWLKSDQAKEFKEISNKLHSFVAKHQVSAAEIILDYARDFLPNDLYFSLIYTCMEHNNKSSLPRLNCEDWALPTHHEKYHIAIEKVAYEYSLPVDALYGADDFFLGETTACFDAEEYMKIRTFLAYEQDDICQLNYISCWAATLFSTYRNFSNFVQRWANFTNGKLDLKNHFSFEETFACEGVNYNEWGEAALKYGPKILFYLPHAYMLEEFPRDKNGQILFHQFKDILFSKIIATRHDINSTSIDLYKFCFDHQLTEREFNGALYLLENYPTETDAQNSIPNIEISGDEFGLPNYSFKKLSHNDYRSLFLGRYTGCCERIFDHCQNSILHAHLSLESGFYVITDTKDNIIAHSWVWRSKENDLVFDGFEARQNDRRITDTILKKVLQKFSESRADYFAGDGINRIILGVSGKKLNPQFMLKEIEITTRDDEHEKWLPKEIEDYFDVTHGYLGYSSKFYVVKDLRLTQMKQRSLQPPLKPTAIT